jgi:ketosteroid isomerase-like protein
VSEELLRRAYAAFSARDLDGALVLMHPDVAWPNAIDGGRVHGHDEVRAYWERQFETIDPHVEPEGFSEEDGRIAVAVHQVVRTREGELLADQRLRHVYTVREGRIARMEIEPYELEFEDTFHEGSLDLGKWIPYYLPHWSTRERSAARYRVEGGCLRLVIEEDQEPWYPELDGNVRVSSLQTGIFASPLGSRRWAAPLQPGCGRSRGAAECAPLHASLWPDRAAGEGARRPALDGRPLADRLRG